MALLKV